MFRAVLCSSSGGQIVLLQHLVSSVSVNGRTVCRLRADSKDCPVFELGGLAFWKSLAHLRILDIYTLQLSVRQRALFFY